MKLFIPDPLFSRWSSILMFIPGFALYACVHHLLYVACLIETIVAAFGLLIIAIWFFITAGVVLAGYNDWGHWFDVNIRDNQTRSSL